MDGYEPVGIQHASGKGSNLCAYSRPLVEGVSGAGGTVRLYDSLYSALTGDVNHAVGIGAKHEGLVYAVHGAGGVIDDLGVGSFDEHYAEHLAQLAVIYLLCVAVLGNVLPQGIALKVVHGIGVYDADVMRLAALTGELTGLILLQSTDGLADFLNS